MQPLLSPADLKLMLRSPGFPRTYRNSPPVTHPALTPPLTVQRHEGAGLQLPSPQAPHLLSAVRPASPGLLLSRQPTQAQGLELQDSSPISQYRRGSLFGGSGHVSFHGEIRWGRAEVAQPSCGCKKGHCARGQGGSLSCPNAPPRPHGSSGVRGWGQQGREGLWPGDRGSPPSPAGPGARRKLLLPTGPVSPS